MHKNPDNYNSCRVIIGLNRLIAYTSGATKDSNTSSVIHVNELSTLYIDNGVNVVEISEDLQGPKINKRYNGNYLVNSSYIYSVWKRSVYNQYSFDLYEALLASRIKAAKIVIEYYNIQKLVFCDIPHHVNEVAWHLAGEIYKLDMYAITCTYGGHNAALIKLINDSTNNLMNPDEQVVNISMQT